MLLSCFPSFSPTLLPFPEVCFGLTLVPNTKSHVRHRQQFPGAFPLPAARALHSRSCIQQGFSGSSSQESRATRALLPPPAPAGAKQEVKAHRAPAQPCSGEKRNVEKEFWCSRLWAGLRGAPGHLAGGATVGLEWVEPRQEQPGPGPACPGGLECSETLPSLAKP